MIMAARVDETKSTGTAVMGEVEDTLNEVVNSLREASVSALELSEDASVALSHAASEVMRVAETLRKNSVETAKDIAREAVHEVQKHPLASVAAALTAVGALVGVIVATRGK
jgi:ElaB/YqjD/DUF883 family membrane-anchored ribosome-binding protein